jgi:gluconolactonase
MIGPAPPTIFSVMRTLLPLLLLTTASSHSAEPLFQVSELTPKESFTRGIEGPACDREGNLYVVNIEEKGTIAKVTPDGRTERWITLPEGSTGNGIRFNRAGTMFVADYTGHNVLQIDPKTKQVSVLAHEPSMHQPNDLAIDLDGTLYASDPDWKNGEGALWRIAQDGTVTRLADGHGTTNGIEVSPDGSKLYVAESKQQRVLAYDLDESGISNETVLITFEEHGLDGLRCDVDGNLYVTRHGAGVVLILSPEGKTLRSIKLPGSMPSNLCFGGPDGKTVYVTEVENQQVLQFRADRPGLSWKRWQE